MEQDVTQPGGKPSRKKWLLLPILLCLVAVGIVIGLVVSKGMGMMPGEKQATLAETGGELDTPIGKLVFPEEWAEDVSAKDVSTDGQYAVSIYATVEKEEILLFTLSIGEGGSGYQLGSAPGSDGAAQPIFLDISAIEGKSSWSEEDTSRITTLQSCVNELIDQINQLDGFEPSPA